MKKIYFLFFFLLLFAGCNQKEKSDKLYAVAKLPTPVLYTADFSSVFGGKDGSTLKLDEYGEVDELEFVAFPGTVFDIVDTIQTKPDIKIYQVTTDEYPYETEKGYYIDSRFVETTNNKPPNRQIILPSTDIIITNLLASEGASYTWGGNYKQGIPELLSWYLPKTNLSTELSKQWMLQGVDCSGLIYEATNGYTPRNTSLLLNFGRAIEIAGKNQEEIATVLQPLDLIVWDGHVIIVINNQEIIESRLDYDKNKEGMQGGVRRRSIKEVLNEIMSERSPVNNYNDQVEGGKKTFVVRRWI